MLLLQRSQALDSQEVSASVPLSYQSTIQSTCENLAMLPLQRRGQILEITFECFIQQIDQVGT